MKQRCVIARLSCGLRIWGLAGDKISGIKNKRNCSKHSNDFKEGFDEEE